MRYREYLQFPRLMQMGALSDPELVYKAGLAIGQELSQLHIYVNYAPDTDVNNNPANPVINARSFGQDPDKVAEFGSAYMRGMRDGGVYGSAKHFPGHGDTDVDSHKGLPVLTFGRDRLDKLELVPFRRLIADGVEMVMVGHLAVPALDPTMTPASISKPIVTGLLREELGFDGIIITDALQMKGLTNDFSDASVAAYMAGADILLMPVDVQATIDNLDAAFEKGELDEAGLDMRVRKVLDLKRRAGMLKKGYKPQVDIDSLEYFANRPQTEALIQTMSDRSMTVLRGAQYLPLKAGLANKQSTKKKLAYISVNAVSDDCPAFEEELAKTHSFDMFELYPDDGTAGVDSIAKLIRNYKDVVVVFHCGKPVNRTGGPYKFAKPDPGMFDAIASLSRRHKLHGVLMGNPYELDKLPQYKKFTTFIVAYTDSRNNNIAAARALGGIGDGTYGNGPKPEGVLPVDAGGLNYGFSDFNQNAALDKILHPSLSVSPYCSSFNRNQVRTRSQLAPNDNMDIITYVAMNFPNFTIIDGIPYSRRSGSIKNTAGTLDVVQLYAMGIKVDWNFVSSMRIKDVENLYVLSGNEAALYEAAGGVVILDLKSARNQ